MTVPIFKLVDYGGKISEGRLSPDWQRGRILNPSDTKKNDTRIVTIVGMEGQVSKGCLQISLKFTKP